MEHEIEHELYRSSLDLNERLARLSEGPALQRCLDHWLVCSASAAQSILTQPRRFTSAFGTGLRSPSGCPVTRENYRAETPPWRSLNLSDPPFHSSLRRVARAWMRERWMACQERLQALTWELIAQTNGDWMQEVACPLAWSAVRDLMEIPPELNEPFRQAVCAVAMAPNAAAWREGESQLQQLLQDSPLGPTLGDPVDRRFLARLLLLAGWGSTAAALGNLLMVMMESGSDSPTRQAAVWVEQSLRRRPAISRFSRLVLEHVQLEGYSLHPGERVMIVFPAVNRSLPEPHHLTFGSGVHRCLGVTVARNLLIWSADGILRRGLPRWAGSPRVWPSAFTLGFSQLPLEWP